MHILGIGVHVLVALLFAVHAVRTGRNLFWLIVLFSFPLLGSLVYFFVEYWPDMRQSRGARAAGAAFNKMVDPARELREAKRALELTPTVQNRLRLADALSAAGQIEEARNHLQDCLSGQHATDADVLVKLAAVQYELRDAAATAATLQRLFAMQPERQTGNAALMYARALGASGDASAEEAFMVALRSASGPEAKLRFGQWLASQQRYNEARLAFEDIRADARHWTAHAAALNKAHLREAETALAELDKRERH